MSEFNKTYDVAVVGGGHAGLEAALASARMGLTVLLVTQTIESIGRMSCNPSIGGIAKGNIAREVDALGGEMGRLIDNSMIQFRMLNKSRGPAVQAPRAQADKFLYADLARRALETQSGLDILMDTVVDLETHASYQKMPPRTSRLDEQPLPGQREGRAEAWQGMRQTLTAIITERGRRIPVRAAVLTTGTFLGGRIFIGDYDAPAGRLGEPASQGLTEVLNRLGFTTGRLKTGTPLRVLRRSVDLSRLELQYGDEVVVPFSFDTERIDRPSVPCYIAFTNEGTHGIIRSNIVRSPLFRGKISGTGPRYCPSIEDKVVRFAERERHQLFIEPEGLNSEELYINGISSSLPEEVQDSFMRTLPGFAHARMTRPGYAVEYDFIDPTQLMPSLETKPVAGLFSAGQINGTSGYEEAAGQGIVAGINAGIYARSHRETCGPAEGDYACHSDRVREIPEYEALILLRSEAYIGVLIDDLVTLGTREPYRMFTARAEYRLTLRHDTADRRLSEKGFQAGLKTTAQIERVRSKVETIKEIQSLLASDPAADNPGFPPDIWEQALIDRKYGFYIEKQDRRIERLHRMEHAKIPADFNYAAVAGLSHESVQKLERVRPATLGQAGRVSGVRKSDIMLLMTHLRV